MGRNFLVDNVNKSKRSGNFLNDSELNNTIRYGQILSILCR